MLPYHVGSVTYNYKWQSDAEHIGRTNQLETRINQNIPPKLY